ncbi:MAG: tetratricopeptide repeat protein, partial [Calditrichota bacterium]
WGWLILFGPASIVIFLTLIPSPEWLVKQGSEGAVNEAVATNKRGLIALKEGNLEKAMGHFNAALKIKPDYAEPMMNIGIVYQTRGDYDRAITCLNQAINMGPSKKELIYNNLGMVYGKKGDYDTALRMFLKALEVNVRTAVVYRNIGQIHLARKNYEAAGEAFRNAVANAPGLLSLYNEMIRDTYYDLTDAEDEEDMEILKSVEQTRNIGVTESDLQSYDSQIIEEYTGRDPKLADDYKNLGIAYSRLEQPDSAFAAWQASIRINPRDPEVLNKIGIYFASRGYLSDALRAFQNAVALRPNYEEAQFNLDLCRKKLGGGE